MVLSVGGGPEAAAVSVVAAAVMTGDDIAVSEGAGERTEEASGAGGVATRKDAVGAEGLEAVPPELQAQIKPDIPPKRMTTVALMERA